MTTDHPVRIEVLESSRDRRRMPKPQSHPMTAERELELAARIKIGDPAAREELIVANLSLVRSIASGFRGRDRVIDLNDLIQEGNLGLLRAASDFDPETHGTRFVGYAACWIRYAIRRVLAERTSAIRYPYYLVLLRRRFDKARERLIAAGAIANGSPDADVDAVAETAGLDGKRLNLLRGELNPRSIASIDDPSCDAALARPYPPHEPVEVAESMDRLHAGLRRLGLIESWLLRRRYRLDESSARPTERRRPPRRDVADSGRTRSRSNGWRTFRELSDEIGMPIHQLRAIERTALAKLQRLLDPDAIDGSSQPEPMPRGYVAARKSA